MERGDIVTVQIEDMSSEGQGIGRADGLVIWSCRIRSWVMWRRFALPR